MALGVLINLPAIIVQWHLGWDYRWCAFLLQAPRELGTPLQALGYTALVFGYWPCLARLKLMTAVACVGRMALTNYLLQSLICTTLFNRFGLFMQFDRSRCWRLCQRSGPVNLAFSVLWLRYFRQGPLEWLWRRLTRLAAGAPQSVSSR